MYIHILIVTIIRHCHYYDYHDCQYHDYYHYYSENLALIFVIYIYILYNIKILTYSYIPTFIDLFYKCM